ncbi:GNAT family N-acetyltransferase [Tessaracoccus sp.]
MTDDALAGLFAPFGLRITAGDITLRLFRDSDLPAYAELVSSRLFADESAPHVFDWWTKDAAVRLRNGLQFLWTARAGIEPESWTLTMGVFEGDRLIGSQDMGAKDFARLRVVDSGSYLRLDAQGRGVGTLMRQMMLVFAFDHLGAVRAESGAIVGNETSLAVSRHCGYRLDGTAVVLNGESRVELQRVAATPHTFIRPDRDVQVHGLTPQLREQLGAAPRR